MRPLILNILIFTRMEIMNRFYNIYTVILFAYLVGSFLNVVISRLPYIVKLKKGKKPFKHFNLAIPRSHCPLCFHQLSWWQNIPMLSYIILAGKCYFCRAPINKRYLIVELSFMFLMAINYYQSPSFLICCLYTVFTALALCIVGIDSEEMLIPDVLNYLLLWAGLFANAFSLFTTPQAAILGAGLAYLGLWTFYHFILWTTGQQGFGYGDFKLLAALSAWCGLLHIFNILVLACLLGLIFALTRYKKIGEPLPFGPALCLAGYLVLLFPAYFNLMNWSQNWF